ALGRHRHASSERISTRGKRTDRSGESDTYQICDNDRRDGKRRSKHSQRPKYISQRALDNTLWNSDRDLPSSELRAGKGAAHQLALGIRSLPGTLILSLVLNESFRRPLPDESVEFSAARHEHGVAINDRSGAIRQDVGVKNIEKARQFEA